jgi:hypothetical protein
MCLISCIAMPSAGVAPALDDSETLAYSYRHGAVVFQQHPIGQSQVHDRVYGTGRREGRAANIVVNQEA